MTTRLLVIIPAGFSYAVACWTERADQRKNDAVVRNLRVFINVHMWWKHTIFSVVSQMRLFLRQRESNSLEHSIIRCPKPCDWIPAFGGVEAWQQRVQTASIIVPMQNVAKCVWLRCLRMVEQRVQKAERAFTSLAAPQDRSRSAICGSKSYVRMLLRWQEKSHTFSRIAFSNPMMPATSGVEADVPLTPCVMFPTTHWKLTPTDDMSGIARPVLSHFPCGGSLTPELRYP